MEPCAEYRLVLVSNLRFCVFCAPLTPGKTPFIFTNMGRSMYFSAEYIFYLSRRKLMHMNPHAATFIKFLLTNSFRPHSGPRDNSGSNRHEYQQYFLGVKGVGLKTLPPSCADCLEIWEPQHPETPRACNGIALPLLSLTGKSD
jgi:hypothetical protein